MSDTILIKDQKPDIFSLLQKIGGTILFIGLIAYFVTESIFGSMFLLGYEGISAIIMTYIVDVMGIILSIFFIIWILKPENQKEKALKNAFSCLFFYIFLFSISQFFFPAFYDEPISDISLISIIFNYCGLNFTGLIVMTALSLIAFIFITYKPKDEIFSSNQKLIGTTVLLILVIISSTMIYQFRAAITIGSSYYYGLYSFVQTHLFFTDRLAELIIVILVFILTLLIIVLKNKTIKSIARNIVLLTVCTSYLALSGKNGIIFSVPEAYIITFSIANLIICIGAPLVISGSLLSLGQQLKKTPQATQETPITTPKIVTVDQVYSEDAFKPPERRRKAQPKKKDEAIKETKEELHEKPKEAVEDEDTFVETERYDELFETGLFHIQKREFDRAIEYWERCVKAKPDYLPAWNNLGLAYKDIEQIDKAINCWSRALEIDPNYAEAAHNLEVALLLKRKKK